MADHNVTAAAQHFAAEEAAAENACARAATAHGLTAEQAENCDDCNQGCPACPWRKYTTPPDSPPTGDQQKDKQETDLG
jgi:hypothetical protein